MTSDLERRIASSAPAPTRPIDPTQLWTEARRRRQARFSRMTAGMASVVLVAAVAVVAAEPASPPQPVIDAPQERQLRPADEAPSDEDLDDVPTSDTDEEPVAEPAPEPDEPEEPEDPPAPDDAEEPASGPASPGPAEPEDTTGGGDGAADPAQEAPVRALAKTDGFRDGLEFEDVPWALLEVAGDRATAERAWAENVPADLPERDGRPARSGRYGSLDDVDFDRQVLVVWHAGQSGTCPAWLQDVRTDREGVHVTLDSTASEHEGCTDDYRGYRMVLAVDRDRLPDPADLADRELHGVPDGRIRAYPAGG